MTTHLSKKGFTLIETLVAISILLLSITAPLSIASQGLSSAYIARDEITAFYLAQEAMEFILSRRERNFLTNSSWLSGLPSTTGAPFTIDSFDRNMVLCGGGGCPAIEYNPTTGFYSHNDPGGNPSKFTRSVSVTELSNHEAAVLVTISWSVGSLNRSFSVRENIFKWK
jgi:prepilin-type N-terminal cleavage/methylation domain-containing protein